MKLMPCGYNIHCMNKFPEADLCVKCGLCLPHCPTYQQSLDENESPRGRISLIQGWSNGQLEATETLQKHLDHCLLCRACEKACPAFVPYGQLMDRYRAEIAEVERKGSGRLQNLLSSEKKLRWASRLLRIYKKSGISWLLRMCGVLSLLGLKRHDAMLPRSIKAVNKDSNQGEEGKEVALFNGCMGRLLDGETVNSTKQLLNRLGYRVVMPEGQNCCGAVALHDGDVATAETLANQNSRAFTGAQTVLTIASGCGATLLEYPSHFPEITEAKQLAGKVKDINQFLVNNWPDEIMLKAFPKKVFIHTPCSLKNVMHQPSGPEQLLAKIPEIELIKDAESQHCCGAAGKYLLDYPEMASRLADGLIDQIEVLNPDYLVSSNIGCAMHLQAGIAARGLKTEIVHPIVLLEKALL